VTTQLNTPNFDRIAREGELPRVAPTVVVANPQLANAFGAQQPQAAALLSVIPGYFSD